MLNGVEAFSSHGRQDLPPEFQYLNFCHLPWRYFLLDVDLHCLFTVITIVMHTVVLACFCVSFLPFLTRYEEWDDGFCVPRRNAALDVFIHNLVSLKCSCFRDDLLTAWEIFLS